MNSGSAWSEEAVRVVALVGFASGGVLVKAGDYVPAGVNQPAGGAASAAVEVHSQKIGQVGLGGHGCILSQSGARWRVPCKVIQNSGSHGSHCEFLHFRGDFRECGFRPHRAGNGVYCALSAIGPAAARRRFQRGNFASEEWQR